MKLTLSDGSVISWDIDTYNNGVSQKGWYGFISGGETRTFPVVFNFNRISYEDYVFLWLTRCQFSISIPIIWQLMESHNGKPLLKKEGFWEISGDTNSINQRIAMGYVANMAVQRINSYSVYQRPQPDAQDMYNLIVKSL